MLRRSGGSAYWSLVYPDGIAASWPLGIGGSLLAVGVARDVRTLAETVGFEPTMQVLPAYSLSRGAPSATRSRLRARCGDSSPPLVSRGRAVAAQATCGASSSKARCNARTASSMYFSSITTEVLI